MTKLLNALRRTSLAAIINAGALVFSAAVAHACDCTRDSYGYQPYDQQSYDEYPCYAHRFHCGYGRYSQQYDDPYEDSYYAHERLDPYGYYNPDYDDEHYDNGDCDEEDCY
jgi:hypothetical protein